MNPTTVAETTNAVALNARPSLEFDAHVAAALDLLRAAAAQWPGAVVQASSLGVEDMVLTDLIARERLPIPVATLDTGRLHAETLDVIERVRRRYGIDVEVWRPDADAVRDFVAARGPNAMYASVELRHACCALRKLEPLQRMLRGRQAWITGLRREQSGQRGRMAARERDGEGRTKFSPLIDWTLGDVWHYVGLHGVPYNALHDRHFPSIGCAPCTRAISPGEDFRAGRWWWENEAPKECGLHLAHESSDTAADHLSAEHGAHP